MIRRKAVAQWRCLLFLLAIAASPAWAVAQTGFAPVADESSGEVQLLLNEGLQLEKEQRWGEALSHYEEASRQFPANDALRKRVRQSRIHFDLGRRYVDESYLHATRTMSLEESLKLYDEVGQKIQSYYVDEPNWNELLREGTRSLTVAMTDEGFVRVTHATVNHDEAQRLIEHIWQVLHERQVQNRSHARDMVRWITQLTESKLGLPSNVVALEYVCGMANCLDSYSAFLTGDQLEDVYSQIEGNFVGLGIELKADDGSLLIADVIEKGPADRAGIRAGERIVAVNGKSTAELSTDLAADMLKGEEGSVVDVTVRTTDGASRVVSVRRERVEVPSVEDVKMIDPENGVGYFRISSFQKTTSRDVDVALWRLHREGMRSLIIDVRGNPGGLLTESVEVADRFVMEGRIVSTLGRSARENYDYKAHRVGTWRVPLVVLIDGDSASASEIFAGAIHDHGRGKVVGVRSYGKGSVQGIFPLRTVNGGIRLTTAKFYSPSGREISKGGVDPDIVVRTAGRPAEGGVIPGEGQDEVLRAGVKIAIESLASRQPVRQAEIGSAAPGNSASGMLPAAAGRPW